VFRVSFLVLVDPERPEAVAVAVSLQAWLRCGCAFPARRALFACAYAFAHVIPPERKLCFAARHALSAGFPVPPLRSRNFSVI
jgi:hypothetical protein